MKIRKLSTILVLFILIALSLTSCKKKQEESTESHTKSEATIEQVNEETTLQLEEKLKTMTFDEKETDPADAYKELGYAIEESADGFSLTTLKKELSSGTLSEKNYHIAVVSLAYDTTFFIDTYGSKLIPESYDPSSSLQWMIDHPDELNDREAQMLQKAILPKDSFDFLNELTPQKTSSLLDYILPGYTVHAEEAKSDYTLIYPIGFSQMTAILYNKENVSKEKVSLTKDIIDFACYKYFKLLGEYKKGGIYFAITDTLPAVVGSQTYEFDGTIVLQISNKLSTRDYSGVLLEKLFYIYGAPLFTTSSLQIDWLRQATSAWAIDHVSPNLNYEHRYIPHIYNNIFYSYYLSSLDGVKSWYQYFLYVTQVLGKDTYVKDLYAYIINNPNDHDMNHILSVGTDEAGFREYIAKFGMCLAGGDSYSGKLSSIDSITQYVFLPEESLVSTDVKEMKLSDWKDVGLYQGDYYHLFISTNNLEEEGLNIINNMGAEISKKRGMAIGLTKNNQTDWIMTPNNEMPLYHIDFKSTPADYVHILIYNSDMMDVNTYQYALGQESSMSGNGNLKVTYSKVTALENGYASEEVSWSADEVLEKIKLDGSSDMNGLWHTMIGESYMVKEIALDYRYKNEFIEEETGFEEMTDASGIYFYNSAEEAVSTNPLESLIPDLEGVTEQLNLATEMLEGLPGVDLGDMGLSNQDMDLLHNGLDADSLGLSDEEMAIFNQLMQATKGIQRIRYDASINSLMLYPALPMDLINEEWIEGTKTTKSKNSEGEIVTTTEELVMKAPVLFPQWFYNPDGMTPDDSDLVDTSSLENYSAYANIDMKELLDKIKGVSTTGNAVNVMSLNGKGPIEMDMGGPGNGGTVLESIHFDGHTLIALLSWIDVKDDTTFKCTIELGYSFE